MKLILYLFINNLKETVVVASEIRTECEKSMQRQTSLTGLVVGAAQLRVFSAGDAAGDGDGAPAPAAGAARRGRRSGAARRQ